MPRTKFTDLTPDVGRLESAFFYLEQGLFKQLISRIELSD